MARKAAAKKAAARKAGSTFFSAVTRRTFKRTPVKAVTSVKKGPTPSAASKRTGSRRKESFEPGLVFVAMAFNGTRSNDVFSAIKGVSASLGLDAKRVDENLTSGFIILEIVKLIERAEFLIFDLTGERPNVYYELGYAHGVGNAPSNVLLVAKRGAKLHFDIAGMRTQFYGSTENLRKIVKTTLEAMIAASR